jgi:hypothetical protein
VVVCFGFALLAWLGYTGSFTDLLTLHMIHVHLFSFCCMALGRAFPGGWYDGFHILRFYFFRVFSLYVAGGWYIMELRTVVYIAGMYKSYAEHGGVK